MNSSNAPSESQAAQALQSAGVAFKAGKSGKIRAASISPDTNVDNVDWTLFAALPHLARFEAAGSAITDEQLTAIASLPGVAQIDLSQAVNITDASRSSLEQMPKLQLIKLTGSSMTSATIKDMRKAMIQARIVFL